MRIRFYKEFEGLGEKIKQARIEKGISQAELGRRLGLTRARINQIESESINSESISEELILKIIEELK